MSQRWQGKSSAWVGHPEAAATWSQLLPPLPAAGLLTTRGCGLQTPSVPCQLLLSPISSPPSVSSTCFPVCLFRARPTPLSCTSSPRLPAEQHKRIPSTRQMQQGKSTEAEWVQEKSGQAYGTVAALPRCGRRQHGTQTGELGIQNQHQQPQLNPTQQTTTASSSRQTRLTCELGFHPKAAHAVLLLCRKGHLHPQAARGDAGRWGGSGGKRRLRNIQALQR